MVARVVPALREREADARAAAVDEDGVAAGLHCASPWGGEKAKYSYTLQKKVGTPKCHSYPNERIGFSAMPSPEKIAYDPDAPVDPRVETLEIGRASCRERVCQYV